MNTETGKIAEALAAFQAEMPTVAKSHTAKVPTKTGGSYSYTYAGLPDVSAAASPILAKHGLAFSCCPRAGERGYELHGRLLHTSGEELTGALPMAGNTPQEIGSSLTYMRRYLFGCITGLVTDDDDDGNLAQSAKKTTPAKRADTPPPGPREPATLPPPGYDFPDPISKAQLGKIGALMSELGIKEREEALGYVANVIKRTVSSRNDLTKAEAHRVIEALTADAERASA